jgi:hypothetical protein
LIILRPVTFREDHPVWERVFTVNPLVVVGTREESGAYDLAPKHLAMPMGWENYFGFVCTPRHNTYHNARREGVFTVSYPRPTQVLLASLAAAPRDTDGSKLAADALPTFPASEVDGVFVEDAYLFLECALDRIADDFGNLPDLVTGLATSTRAGIELVEKLSGIQALNVLDRDSFPQLRRRSRSGRRVTLP